jgi:uncharacterized protein (DUF302 family)
MPPDGLIISQSRFGPRETMDRAAEAVTERGMAILARIDHAAAAARGGVELPPTVVLIFGSARAGTPLMQKAQTIGIDLPLKALVWRDEAEQTWFAYNDPAWLAKRHGEFAAASPQLGMMTALLAAIAKTATGAGEAA